MHCNESWRLAIRAFTALALTGSVAAQSEEAVWIYRDFPQNGMPDKRPGHERMFAPFGFMPASRTNQITVNQQMPSDENDASKGTCIEYYFEFRDSEDWMGAYTLVNGDAWGTEPGINVQRLLGVGPDAKLALRFKAKGDGTVSFKIGGVRDGQYKSSLVFARATDPALIQLANKFQEYTIGPIAARDLTNLIDPFCVVTSAVNNLKRESVRVFVDDIRIEPYSVTKQNRQLPENWRQQLGQTLFIAYTPTGFDPTAKTVKEPKPEDIRADLTAIRSLADAASVQGNSAGIITYGCRNGLEAIPQLAREANLSVILGIFNPRDQVEIENAAKLLKDESLRETIVACCVGNEAITFRRASLDEIQAVIKQLRQLSAVPMTTTEIVQSYGDNRLFSFDFSLVNVHSIFSDIFDPLQGAHWTVERMDDLAKAAPPNHLILIKEIGWPSGPEPHFNSEQQARFWSSVLSNKSAQRMNVCIFDGLSNVPWKREMIRVPGVADKVNIGPYWSVLFQNDRKPKESASEIIRLWKQGLVNRSNTNGSHR